MISPILFSSFASIGLSSWTTTATVLTASVAKDFFLNVFLNPGEHYIALIAFGVIVVGTCVGLAYLIKAAFEKCLHKPG